MDSQHTLRSLILSLALFSSASCGSDAPKPVPIPACRATNDCFDNGDSCTTAEDCMSGYCGPARLPYEVESGELCRPLPACELPNCDNCAHAGELRRTDVPKDSKVCVDECLNGEADKNCKLCGCPENTICNPESGVCSASPLLAAGSICTEPSDCESGQCRASTRDGAEVKECAQTNGTSCVYDCAGGTCWTAGFTDFRVCLADCDTDADCPGSTDGRASYACVQVDETHRQCRYLCTGGCGLSVSGGASECSTAHAVSGDVVSICAVSE